MAQNNPSGGLSPLGGLMSGLPSMATGGATATVINIKIPNDPNAFGAWAGKTIPIATDSAGNITSTTVKNGLAGITDPTVLQNIYNAAGFENPALGKTLDARINNVAPYLQKAKGDITKVDVPLIASLLQLKNTQQALGIYQNALSTGNDAALFGARTSAKYAAEANVDSVLSQWGIDTKELRNLVSKMVANGVVNQSEILQNVRDTKTYQKAFAGLSEYNSVPGHVKMTESEYRVYSQAVLGAAQQYGNFSPSQEQIGQLLKGNVSAAEFNQRVQDIGAAVANADPNVKELLKKEFGVDTHHLFAWYANPKETLPDLQRAVATTDIQDYASRVGLGGLNFKGAEQLAGMAKLAATKGNQNLGYGVSQIEQGLLGASRDVALTKSLPGTNAPTVNTNTLIASQLAGFGGINQIAAQTQVARAEQAKVAPFEKGGGYAESAKGVVGLGAART